MNWAKYYDIIHLVLIAYNTYIIMKLDNNNHSVFSLNYHLIFCTKYRQPVINETISLRLKEIFERIAIRYKIQLQEWKHDQDHIHALIKGEPKSELSKFINSYKSASSRLIKKEFPQLRQRLWQEYFWSRSYLLLTVGGAPIEVLKQYISSQGEKRG